MPRPLLLPWTHLAAPVLLLCDAVRCSHTPAAPTWLRPCYSHALCWLLLPHRATSARRALLAYSHAALSPTEPPSWGARDREERRGLGMGLGVVGACGLWSCEIGGSREWAFGLGIGGSREWALG